jgi:hypothetical protein
MAMPGVPLPQVGRVVSPRRKSKNYIKNYLWYHNILYYHLAITCISMGVSLESSHTATQA